MDKVLTIAGSDSSGGAGIQADIKTILSLGGYAMSVITALTAQNTLGVQSVRMMDCDFISQQIDAVLGDIGADCVKTGMLGNADIATTVASKLKEYQIDKLIVDPVMVSKSGAVLLEEDARKAMIKNLFPICYL
ncbi:MAG: bifunctional hydroxymethylpyrimidine kinase/phosphomethylpyrimidine kinase, partial [Syntrophaceae bacterium]|nr:bifunctional hydroxymethylpyrimidine kinase/phosphomethylpyrimidine kinase [Syntrophaceae bacterium]